MEVRLEHPCYTSETKTAHIRIVRAVATCWPRYSFSRRVQHKKRSPQAQFFQWEKRTQGKQSCPPPRIVGCCVGALTLILHHKDCRESAEPRHWKSDCEWGASWSNWHRDLGNFSSCLQCPSCNHNKQLCPSAEESSSAIWPENSVGYCVAVGSRYQGKCTKPRQLEENAGNHRQLWRNKDITLYSSKPQPRRAVTSFYTQVK